jgi:hypothetical protein
MGSAGNFERISVAPRIMRWAERDQAEQAAWAAPGVSEVIDHISVVP